MKACTSWIAGRFKRKSNAINVHRMVDTPRIGILPTTTPIATHSARRRGDMPCFRNASNGSMILRYNQLFKGAFHCVRTSMPDTFASRRSGFELPQTTLAGTHFKS
jgi:hypothetical protein